MRHGVQVTAKHRGINRQAGAVIEDSDAKLLAQRHRNSIAINAQKLCNGTNLEGYYINAGLRTFRGA